MPLGAVCGGATEIGAADHSGGSVHWTKVFSPVRQSFTEPLVPLLEEGLFYDKSKLRFRSHDVNLDGWGLGWYQSSSVVQRRRSANGASMQKDGEYQIDSELEDICNQVRSKVLFSHI
jgi:predicted glutamine amidotransferase